MTFPDKPIRIILPFGPPGFSSRVAFALGPHMAKILGQEVVFEHITGGQGGANGPRAAAEAEPDGYSLLMATIGNIALLPNIMPEYGIDPLTDLEDAPASDAWFQYRCDLISRLVNEDLTPIGRAAGKQMTAAVFPNWRHVRQERHKWEVDAVLPMLYNGFFNEDLQWIGEHCASGNARMQDVGVSKPLYSGLYLPDVPPEQLQQAIDVSMQAGAAGVSLFSQGSLEEGHLQVMQRYFG